jgi:hypothetical protein
MPHLKRFALSGLIPLVILLSLAVAPDAARADPLTISFKIENIVRCEGEECDPSLGIGDPFILTMSFDPAITREETTPPTRLIVEYGPPTFSTVPLPLDVPVPLTDSLRSTTELAFLFTDQWSHAGTALHEMTGATDDLSYRLELFLSGGDNHPSSDRPELSPASFAALLGGLGDGGSSPQSSFLYSLQWRSRATGLVVGRAGWASTDVSLVGQNPIPEPGTLALVGGGLVLFAKGLRASRKSKSSAPSRQRALLVR